MCLKAQMASFKVSYLAEMLTHRTSSRLLLVGTTAFGKGGCLWCRTRGDAEAKREALLKELHELEAKLKPMR